MNDLAISFTEPAKTKLPLFTQGKELCFTPGKKKIVFSDPDKEAAFVGRLTLYEAKYFFGFCYSRKKLDFQVAYSGEAYCAEHTLKGKEALYDHLETPAEQKAAQWAFLQAQFYKKAYGEEWLETSQRHEQYQALRRYADNIEHAFVKKLDPAIVKDLQACLIKGLHAH